MSPVLPFATFFPMAWSTCPKGLRCSSTAYCHCVRRDMALPASTFSAIASWRKRSGAITITLPLATSASSTTPRTPPKWSTCECEYTTPTTGRLPSFSLMKSSAARAVSFAVSGSKTIQPVSPLMKLMLARS